MSWWEMVDVNGFIDEIMNSMGGSGGFFPIYLSPLNVKEGSGVLLANPKTGHYAWHGGSFADEIMWETLPATKLAIQNLPTAEVSSVGSEEECSVCLNKLLDKAAVKIVKEMPCCKQRFHGVCIQKWLARHGSCPLCRHQMLVDGVLSFQLIQREGGLMAWEIDILFPQVP